MRAQKDARGEAEGWMRLEKDGSEGEAGETVAGRELWRAWPA